LIRPIAVLGLILLLGALPDSAHGQECRPSVLRRAEVSRNLPYVLHDQATESLRALAPAHRILVSRRTATIGRVEYALVAYQETSTTDSVRIIALAVDWSGPASWDLSATCEAGAFPDGLLNTMTALARLPVVDPAPTSRPAPPSGASPR
jgi:hypothetical protein